MSFWEKIIDVFDHEGQMDYLKRVSAKEDAYFFDSQISYEAGRLFASLTNGFFWLVMKNPTHYEFENCDGKWSIRAVRAEYNTLSLSILLNNGKWITLCESACAICHRTFKIMSCDDIAFDARDWESSGKELELCNSGKVRLLLQEM